jgi:hypothetical protein
VIEAIGLALAALDFCKLTAPAQAYARKLIGWLQELFGEMAWSRERLFARGEDPSTIVYKPMFYFTGLFVWLPSIVLSIALWWSGDIPWFAVPLVVILTCAILIGAFWLFAKFMLFVLGILVTVLAVLQKVPNGVIGALGLIVAVAAFLLENQ